MDMAPIYELQARLRSAAIAGTNLLQEDFRLKRAADAVKLLENTAPVFAKISQQMDKLLASDSQSSQEQALAQDSAKGKPKTGKNLAGILLDTISLVDAVVCTLGIVDVKKEQYKNDIDVTRENENIKNDTDVKIDAPHYGNAVMDIPYSILKRLLDALTTSGTGHYSYVCDMHNNNPEIFHDYRVKAVLIKALGAPYTELANKAEDWLKESDKTILPLLMKDFDPKGKKEMVRRVRVIEAVAGAEANDFYVSMLDNAKKEIRQELIYALQFDKRNMDLVMNLYKSAKEKDKRIYVKMLADFGNDEIFTILQEQAKEEPWEVAGLLKYINSAQAAPIAADILGKCLKEISSMDIAGNTISKEEKADKLALFERALEASVGKCSQELCQCYRSIFEKGYADKLASILKKSYLICPATELSSLIMELNEKDNTENFLIAALAVQLFGEDGDGAWLDKNLHHILQNKRGALKEVLSLVSWNPAQRTYVVEIRYYDELFEKYATVMRAIDFSLRDKVTKFLTEANMQTAVHMDFDSIMANWCGINCDKEYCKRLGAHFYKGALEYAEPSYIDYLKKCGWTDYKGIVVKSLHICNYMSTWTVYYYIKKLPCDYAAKVEELNAISELVRSGKLIATTLDINQLEELEKDL